MQRRFQHHGGNLARVLVERFGDGFEVVDADDDNGIDGALHASGGGRPRLRQPLEVGGRQRRRRADREIVVPAVIAGLYLDDLLTSRGSPGDANAVVQGIGTAAAAQRHHLGARDDLRQPLGQLDLVLVRYPDECPPVLGCPGDGLGDLGMRVAKDRGAETAVILQVLVAIHIRQGCRLSRSKIDGVGLRVATSPGHPAGQEALRMLVHADRLRNRDLLICHVHHPLRSSGLRDLIRHQDFFRSAKCTRL